MKKYNRVRALGQNLDVNTDEFDKQLKFKELERIAKLKGKKIITKSPSPPKLSNRNLMKRHSTRKFLTLDLPVIKENQ